MTTSKITAVLEPSLTNEVYEKNKNLIEFGKSIDFAPLFQTISKKLGLADTLAFSTPMIRHCGGVFYVECESASIADHVGVLALVLDSVNLTFFSSCIKKDATNKQRPMEERYSFGVQVDFSYRHIEGGSNGLAFAFVWYDKTNGWGFRFVKP